MARFFGFIGVSTTNEISPGVWTETIERRKYYGDVVKNYRGYRSGDAINSNVSLSNQISIVADDYILNNFHSIAYIEFGGCKWRVTNVEIDRPRLILSTGELYNE